MTKLLAALLLTYSMQAHAMLFCFNGSNNVSMTYQNGEFVYQLEAGEEPPPVVANPGPQLLPEYYEDAYCYADGTELLAVYAALPDLKYPAAIKNAHGTVTGFRNSIQPGATQGIVYWTGADAIEIINEF